MSVLKRLWKPLIAGLAMQFQAACGSFSHDPALGAPAPVGLERYETTYPETCEGKYACRHLTEGEISFLKELFKDKLPYDEIRLFPVDNATKPHLAAWQRGKDIYLVHYDFKDFPDLSENKFKRKILAHEVDHLRERLRKNISSFSTGKYDFKDSNDAEAKLSVTISWHDLSDEAKASTMEAYSLKRDEAKENAQWLMRGNLSPHERGKAQAKHDDNCARIREYEIVLSPILASTSPHCGAQHARP